MPCRPIDSGRVDTLGRRITISGATTTGRADAPPPPADQAALENAIRHFTVANDLTHPEAAALAEHLTANAAVSPRPVFRGLYGTHLSGIPYHQIEPGLLVHLPAASSSPNQEVAESFSWDDTGDDDDYAVTLELLDAEGVDIAWASQFPDQEEWLLTDGNYVIESIDTHPHDDMQLHIVARRIR